MSGSAADFASIGTRLQGALLSVKTVNVMTIDSPDEFAITGFRHRQTALRDLLGAHMIGATAYVGYAGCSIFPYGYHHGVEEWMYVTSGAPVLREAAGERTLSSGDFVCFRSGDAGAHALSGEGRYVMFSTGDHIEPWLSVYPDSDKVSGPDAIFPRSSAVGYWHEEGTIRPTEAPAIVRREHEITTRLPVVNGLSIAATPGGAHTRGGSRL